MSCGALPGFRAPPPLRHANVASPVAGGLDRPFGPSQIACSGAAPIPHPCVETVQQSGTGFRRRRIPGYKAYSGRMSRWPL